MKQQVRDFRSLICSFDGKFCSSDNPLLLKFLLKTNKQKLPIVQISHLPLITESKLWSCYAQRTDLKVPGFWGQMVPHSPFASYLWWGGPCVSPFIGFQEQKKGEVFYPRQLMTVESSGIYRLEVQQETISEQSKSKNTVNKKTHTHHQMRGSMRKAWKCCVENKRNHLKQKYAAHTRRVFLSDDVSNRFGKFKQTE